jgi:hypothetical protein
MAGGQAIDLAVQGTEARHRQVEDMHARKTGAVIRASVLMAAECVPPLDPKSVCRAHALRHRRGLAFQIQDDLLDVTGDVSTLGKATGADSERASPRIRPSSASRLRRSVRQCRRSRVLASGLLLYGRWPIGCYRVITEAATSRAGTTHCAASDSVNAAPERSI